MAAAPAHSSLELLERSLLYRELQAVHEEILRHKWFESEKRGCDIGYEMAQVDWSLRHYSLWWRERRKQGLPLSFQPLTEQLR